jgi:hypothetical protein
MCAWPSRLVRHDVVGPCDCFRAQLAVRLSYRMELDSCSTFQRRGAVDMLLLGKVRQLRPW